MAEMKVAINELEANKITCDNMVGDVTGTASKAVSDANGNNIADTYFPKSGGELTGTVIKRNINGSFIKLIGSNEYNTGAFLNLFSNGYDSDGGYYKGVFELTAVKDFNNQKRYVLKGTPDGSLLWNSTDLAGSAIVAKSLGANGYVKYASGLIIQWGTKDIDTSEADYYSGEVVFPISFSNDNYVALVTTQSKFVFTQVASKYQTAMYCASREITNANWIAIGY